MDGPRLDAVAANTAAPAENPVTRVRNYIPLFFSQLPKAIKDR